VLIRDATPEDLPEVGEIRVSAYLAGGFLSMGSGYEAYLRGLGTDGGHHVLVAVAPEGSANLSGRIVGTVTLQEWPRAGQVVTGPGEAEIRALAVVPAAQGAGVGRALLSAVIARAADLAIRHLVLCTQPDMRAAHHLYQRADFVRLPERDFSPDHEVTLLAYGLILDPAAPTGQREPAEPLGDAAAEAS
jgi:ribosomal protein S18 acetylase RimI-like enzyme